MHKLTAETIAQIGQELNALELNVVSCWDKLYPNLYFMLLNIITTASAQSRWGTPAFGIQFKGNESDEINGYCLHTGAMQINFGAALLRKLILEETQLEDAPKDIDAAYEEITTKTAQEIEHTCDEMMSKANEELDAHENNIVNNWNILYPHLFTMLNKIVVPISIKAGLPTIPAIAVLFTGAPRHNAMALIFPNGSRQLNIGSGLIRTLLFQAPSEDSDDLFCQFQWVIAHEIGHFADPIFQKYTQFSSLFVVLNWIAQLILIAGITAMFLPMVFSHRLVVLAPNLIATGCIGMLIHQCVLMILHRKFEYAADATSVRLLENFRPEDAQMALTFMNNKIAQDLFCNQPKTKNNLVIKAYNACYKKIRWAWASRRHPSPEVRINKLKKVCTLESQSK
jgi:hypothetical protein